MPTNVREKATPPSHGDIFADVVHNDAFESDENEMEEKTENKYADLWDSDTSASMADRIYHLIKTAWDMIDWK